MKQFEVPTIEIIKFTMEDVLAVSSNLNRREDELIITDFSIK